jgi:hypothetical protein
MKFNPVAVRKCLKSFDFDTLFREHLGWEQHRATLAVPVGVESFDLRAVAEKRGFVAYVCDSLPDRDVRLKIDHQVTKSAREHFVIYCDRVAGVQVWHWVRRQPGRPSASRDHRFEVSQSGDRLIQRLDRIAVGLDEEDRFTLTAATEAVSSAFDVDRVTRRFFDQFKTEHASFLKFIKGIADQGDLEWYTSLMLNRLMFVYFIQKKGFLDGDTDYLRNRLRMVRDARGKDEFHSFYRYFLLRLFHEGLGQAGGERKLDRAMEQLLGEVPYLNGGFFEVHQLEERNREIDIPDKAFEKLFDFFDRFSWHLDERELRADNEINPDVVGYIFEKYINQKQMGAYYTKEDITEYICKNTIIPFLFEAAAKACPIAFQKGAFVWRLLADEPDRYIYAAMRKGVIGDHGNVIPLPLEIQPGLKDVSERQNWNKPATEPYALATETWREHVSRRERCLDLRERLVSGEVCSIHDLVTLNLDLWQFARDAITNAEGPEVVRAFWGTIQRVTVLDPTCGSGAFLFAALRVLETLYSDCLECMERFVEGHAASTHHPEQFADFRRVLAELDKHPNEKYFILKSIIISNVYGVDIMAEAVEICKLRLFLKLVAQVDEVSQIEPLPDIDFNIRCGNTLVGYATRQGARRAFTEAATGQGKLMLGDGEEAYRRFEEGAEAVERAFRQFRLQQTVHGGRITAADKEDLRKKLGILGDELDRFLAAEFGIKSAKKADFEAWRSSHQPFHWFIEFYGIMHNGGFDVIIGNPPYLEIAQVDYRPRGYVCEQSRAIHAMCIERSLTLGARDSALSMIVPLALVSTQRMRPIQELLESGRCVWYANYSWRPGKLFDVVNRALTIFLAAPGLRPSTYSTNYQRWTAADRVGLFERVSYTEVPRSRESFWVPKLGEVIERTILTKVLNSDRRVGHFAGDGQGRVFYRTTGGLYWKVFTDFSPGFRLNGKAGHSSRETNFSVTSYKHVQPLVAVLSSGVFWWWYTVTSNLRDLNPIDIMDFPIPHGALLDARMDRLGKNYLTDIAANSQWLVREQRSTGRTETQSFKIAKSKSHLDAIDAVLAEHYGFSEEELDFIVNYDIKYRVGADEAADGDEG